MDSTNKTNLIVSDWFCGGNSSLWEQDTDLQTVCHTDIMNSILQALSFIIFSLVLLVMKCFLHRQKLVTRFFQRYPLHAAQWALMTTVFLLHLFGLAEGCLTDQTFRTNTLGVIFPTQPHLYVPSICGLVMSVLAMVYYHHMEVWRAAHMSWLFLVYWCFALAGETFHLLGLIRMQLGSILVLRFDLCVLSIAVYFGLVAIQVNNVRVKICCSKRRASASCHDGPPDEAMKYAHDYSGFPSEVSYWWLNWLFRLGFKRPLEQADLGSLPEVHAASYVHNKFKKAYLREKDRARVDNCEPSLWRVYWDVHGYRMVFAMLLKLSGEMCSYVGPIALNGIIVWVGRVREGSQQAREPHFVTVSEFFQHGLVLVGITFLVACIRTLLMQTYEYWCAVVGIHFRSSIQTMVFEKSLRISTFVISSGNMTMGQITNHMSTDAMNIFYMIQFICWMVTVPIQIVVTMTLLVFQLGISALLGVVVFFFIVPIQIIFGNYMARLEKKSLDFSDDRLKMSNEVLQGIKLLKMYGWEDLFGRAIEKIRRSEIWNVSKMMGSYGIIGSLTEAAPLMVTLVSFGMMLPLTGQILTPDVAFSSLALFNLLQDPLFLFPMTFFMTINGAISTARIAAFLAAPEVNMETLASIKTKKTHLGSQSNGRLNENDNYFSDDGTEVPLLKTTSDKLVDSVKSTSHESESLGTYGSLLTSSSIESVTCPPHELPNHIAIKIENGSFTWDPENSQPVLNALSVTIPAGKLTMIVGTVGSGKSSLLSAILEEMTLQKGTIQINGSRKSVAYASQKAWLMNASLKENILFGQPLNRHRYKRVISSCALQADIDILPAGDQTEIGEKGINISGGQKQRISVARAMYSDRDIILLDDPLSALDVHVGKHLFDNGIMNRLRKKKKTVVLVTHQLQYLSQADKILLMRDGAIAHEGTLEDIAAAEPDLYSGYETAVRGMTESEGETDVESRTQELIMIKRQISRQRSFIGEEQTVDTCDERGSLISREEIERGSVSLKVYFFYARAIGLPIALAILLLYPLQAGIIAGSNYWLAEWSNAGLTEGNATDSVYYIKIYAIISVAGMVNSFITTLSTVIGLVIAARKLFNLMLRNILHMPMRFFDTTPLGRIINRFSADTQIIDMKLVLSFDTILFYLMAIVAALVINTIINPLFLAIILPLVVLYYMVQKIFITTSRELQRLDSISKSPIFSFFSETLGGLSTIRAYRKQQSFFDDIVRRVSTNNTPYLYLQTSLRWLAVRLDFVGALVVLIAGLTSVLGSIYGSVDSSLVGLGISYALMVSVYLQQLVRFLAEAEMQMNAVERVKHYTTLAPESYEGIEPPSNWPSEGAISIQNISVRYAEELDAVLKDVSVEIEAGKKVGICGRTGSGKSSLTAALFRIIDTYKGRIVIDGIDIASVPLTTLRRRLAIIPQDPVLFDGTIRMNLDPEFKRSEDELWHALEISQLKNLVTKIEGGLDSQVSEGGENFSVGQRQLFCLARAFLRNAHILIMDEATASIDVETDRILQDVVASAFVNKTVLTIAHRVATILNSDVILTLSQGEVIESDTPENLLANPDSMFASLVNSNQCETDSF